MFFIVNKTKRTIALSDMGIALGPRQAVDLDKIMSRSKSDSSANLKMAVKSGAVEIRSKDDPNKKVVKVVKTKSSPDLDKMKNDIIGEVKGAMAELMAGQQASGMSQSDIDQLKEALLQAIPTNTETIVRTVGGSQDEEVEMDEKTLASINAMAVDNIVKDTEVKSVHYKEEQQENTILDNVDELEDLLG